MSPVYVLDVSGQYRERVANGRVRGRATGETGAVQDRPFRISSARFTGSLRS